MGTNLRKARTAQNRSLESVASEASISAATLSRVETGKQALEMSLFLRLASILNCRPHDLLDGEGQEEDPVAPLAHLIGGLETDERRRLWAAMSEYTTSVRGRGARLQQLSNEVEELMAQLDYVRAQIGMVAEKLKK